MSQVKFISFAGCAKTNINNVLFRAIFVFYCVHKLFDKRRRIIFLQIGKLPAMCSARLHVYFLILKIYRKRTCVLWKVSIHA